MIISMMHITQNILIVLRNDATTWYSVLVFFMMQPLAILQKERKKREKEKEIAECKLQGHPMDLSLKISVLQANFCWLRDFEEVICPWKESVAGKRDNSWWSREFDV